MRKWSERLVDLLFTGESDRWLTILRVGLGLQVVIYAWSLRNDWNYLFASNGQGLISRDLAEALLDIEGRAIPRLTWLVSFGEMAGLPESRVISLTWFFLLVAGLCVLAGFFSRLAAIVAWLFHLCSVKSGGLLSYGVDNFSTIGLFYLMLSPLPDRYALDSYLWKVKQRRPEVLGFFRHVLQVHLCIIYFFGGLAKCLGAGWWNGLSMWRALTRPPFNILPIDTVVRWQELLPVAGIFVCLLEITYPFLIWSKKTRLACLASIIAMHIGIGLSMGMYLFSFTMIVLNVAAFGPGSLAGMARTWIPFPGLIKASKE